MDLEERIQIDHESLKLKYPKLLTLNKEKFGFSISGAIEMIDPNTGKVWETYEICIFVPQGFPNIIPSTFSMDKKISGNRHINGNGTFCLGLPVELSLILGKNYSLIDYIDKLLIPYLATQKLVDLGQGWVNGEYSHEEKGVVEYYKEKLNCKKINTIIQCLRILIGIQRNRPNSTCFCGSRKKYKDCHQHIIHSFDGVNVELFKTDLRYINKYILDKKISSANLPV